MFILISDIGYEFVIERRNQDNSRFSRGLFMNGASTSNGRRTITREMTSCVHDTIHFRVSFSLLCTGCEAYKSRLTYSVTVRILA